MELSLPADLAAWHNDLAHLLQIADDAGRAILSYYGQDYQLAYKSDDSPVTSADKAAHHVIVAGLRALDGEVLIVSEEGAIPDFATRRNHRRLWLVDPLDGTKEFINQSGEFTVNIALIEGNAPLLAVVAIPLTQTAYFAVRGGGAYRLDPDTNMPQRLKAPPLRENQRLRFTVSRSHPDATLSAFLAQVPNAEQIQAGSTLKFCRLAEGAAEVYPRFHALSEWDVAAAHLVAEESGVILTNWQGEPLQYNSPNLKLDGGFLASTDASLHRWLCDRHQSAQ